MEVTQNLAQAFAAWAAWAILHPAAATLLGGVAGGYALGTSKTKSALVEIIRGILVGVAAWGATTLLQMALGGGA